MQIDVAAVLKLIENYESASRAAVICNVRNILMEYGISGNAVYHWLANLLNTTRNTTYSWFAPNRDAKFPLKALLQLSLSLGIPLERLLDCGEHANNYIIRQKKERPTYEAEIKTYLQSHPGASAKDIANSLSISSETARRHLLHIKGDTER